MNENTLLTKLKKEGNTDSNIAALEEEDFKRMSDFTKEFSVSEGNRDSFDDQIVKKEIEFVSVQDYDENINSVDQVIKDKFQSCNKKFRISDDKLLTNIKREKNIVSNIEKLDESTGQLTNQQKKEKESNNEQDCDTNDLKCSICQEIFVEKSYFHNHMMVVHCSVEEKQCFICDKIFKSVFSLRWHMNSHAGIKEFKCFVCNKMFTYKSNLLDHKKIHTGVKDNKCPVCNALFNTKAHLNRHIAIHTGEKYYTCLMCNKMFASKQHLGYHIATHTGEKDYKCSICNKPFGRKSHLNRHMMIHTGVKDHKCSKCNNVFGQKHHLITHMKTHTDA